MKKVNAKETFKTLGFALLFATVFRTFFFQPFAIPSGSMMPNLILGDKLLVEKFIYGYSKYSFPLNMIPFSGKILDFKAPERGDIVVFKLPEQGNEYFIKRVIGLPGDEIEVKNGIVYVNGKANKTEYIKKDVLNIQADGIPFTLAKYAYENGYNSVPVYMYKEKNIDNYSYYIYKFSKDGNFMDDNFAKVKVPENHYFMMGDNRNNSADSRFQSMGFVSEDKIIGKARMIFFSSSAHFYEINKFSSEIYWNRMLQRLDKNIES
ncbi:signal peptidase I [Candidatus Deianiraea vastatrix]|uniref:Signal peptidase I n=1 Tax=Candidatus Deianiraea vastatrix TaxID=2163644 RepID=A0A5B8XE52_9RICK|nr:signal peptidase I [Candidatus Deianiraea vastatrix]QED23155.1 Signal peptidase I [Candidatus Deianiraea vastatrix]